MPLAFDSASHGQITFGFFNIDSDMLLLANRFFFADVFCEAMAGVARGDAAAFEVSWPGYVIEKAEDIGDLMGAIHGIRFTGFIGDTYLRYPFPERDEDFKQKPEGFETQAEFLEMITPYGDEVAIALSGDRDAAEVTLAGLRFTREQFHELVKYVWRGGWPRWRDEDRPAYVLDMKAAIDADGHWMFGGLRLSTASR
jgi:hypothetical protein